MTTTIIKTCRHHGELTRKKVIKAGMRKGVQTYKCKACMRLLHQQHYDKNKAAILKRTSAYKKAHRARYNELARNYPVKEKSVLCPVPEEHPQPHKFMQVRRRLLYALWDLDKLVRKYHQLRDK